MFESCISLTSLNISNFNTNKVIDTTNMLIECGNLDNIDFSNFNTTSLEFYDGMFDGLPKNGTIKYNPNLFNISLIEEKLENWTKVEINN